MNQFVTLFYEWVEALSAHPKLSQISIIVFVINLLIAVCLCAYTFILFERNLKNKKRLQLYKKEFQPFYSTILNSETYQSKQRIQSKFEKQFGKIKKAEIHISIVELASLIENDLSLKFKPNYKNLLEYLLSRNLNLNKSFSLNKAKGLSVYEALILLNKDLSVNEIYTNKRLSHVGTEISNKGLITTKEELFKVLNYKQNTQLNDWDFLIIKRFFSKYSLNALPDFGDWIKTTSDDSQAICFTRLIAEFRQSNSAIEIKNLLSSANEDVRKEAYKALGKLRFESIENELFKLYDLESAVCKYEILKAVACISSGKALDFLKEVYDRTIDTDEKSAILEVMYLYNDDGKALFEKKYSSSGRLSRIIFEHIKNPMLKTVLSEEINLFRNYSLTN